MIGAWAFLKKIIPMPDGISVYNHVISVI